MPGTTYSTREMLARLVAFDTTSRNSNLPLIDFVRDYLAGHGVESAIIPDADGRKASLFATIGPAGVPGIALSAHTDCVPVDGQDWASDPFTLTERDGRLYGRGTCDMKGFVAAVLCLVPELVADPPATSVHIVLSYDEEVGCEGVRDTIAALGYTLPNPKAVIVGEPTSMEVVDAHKSISDYVTEVTGRSAHSSQIDKGANAILAAAELIGEIARMREEMIAAGDPSGRFDPPCTSVHVGLINGGTALNIIPRMCSFTWEIRALPGVDEDAMVARYERFAAQKVEPKLKAIAPDTGIVNRCQIHVRGLAPDPGSAAERLAMRCAGRNETRVVSYVTEAGLFQEKGIASIVCGPGSISQAHQPDEYLEISQLEACEAFLRRVAEEARRGF